MFKSNKETWKQNENTVSGPITYLGNCNVSVVCLTLKKGWKYVNLLSFKKTAVTSDHIT